MPIQTHPIQNNLLGIIFRVQWWRKNIILYSLKFFRDWLLNSIVHIDYIKKPQSSY